MVALGLVFFFGAIGLALIFLFSLNTLAKKYLHGDFKKVEEEEEEPWVPYKEDKVYNHDDVRIDEAKLIDYEGEHQGITQSLFKQAQTYHQYSDERAMAKISEMGFEDTFASKASIKLTIQYIENTQCLLGNIRSIDGLHLFEANCPQEINFHVKIIPKNRFKLKTKWKPVANKQLVLTFTMGPVNKEDLNSSNISIRLYGRQKGAFSRSKVYGECFVSLDQLNNTNEVIELVKRVLPKTRDSITAEKSQTYISVTSESEEEYNIKHASTQQK